MIKNSAVEGVIYFEWIFFSLEIVHCLNKEYLHCLEADFVYIQVEGDVTVLFLWNY
jgi:hypothetical protein